MQLKVIVIGGGAAGFFSAIACAENHPHTEVTLLEAGRQPLTKVLISGGGRCNVTHACFDPAALVQNYPRGGKALRGAFTRFQSQDTVDWFARRGVQLKTEADGRMFPITDNSETIIECLIHAAAKAGVKVRTNAAVAAVSVVSCQLSVISEERKRGTGNGEQRAEKAEEVEEEVFNRQMSTVNCQPTTNSKFEVELKSGEVLECDRLLLATGSNMAGYRIARSLGHQIEPPVPSLFTFNVLDKSLRELAGVSMNPVHLRLLTDSKTKLEQTGALLITHWGLSGPAVLKLSAWGARALHDCHYQAKLLVNWLPELDRETLRSQILSVKTAQPKKAIASYRGVNVLPHRLWQYLIVRAGIAPEDRWAGISNKEIDRLIQEIAQAEYLIQGKGAFKEEFVTCGGVKLKEVDFKTMQSRLVPGLYFAGEILDIDGVTGGFNFQSAWTTAWLAGQAMGNSSQ
ncbi:NAD(P)/FAD-dependent oxidoreductase [Scytonema millei]|uniref:NAD(P)/FAD-dependent oxidoreductase n=1 Tax=Scytonema millei VB511283 TaxID=1245923 RepID=A0A9X5E839_9CYAN|nr:NAD(P)/FAD-dependent oxidoreductase [Scytonema millei]NHC36513.1 NAD(P)/FAD-dependent oxidoreductase [Scytonema millei VB511283]